MTFKFRACLQTTKQWFFHPITVALLSEFLIVVAYLFILLVLGWAAAWLELRAHRSSAAVNCQSGFWWRQAPFLHRSVVFVGGISSRSIPARQPPPKQQPPRPLPVPPYVYSLSPLARSSFFPGLTGSSTPSASTAGWDGPGARFLFSFRMGWRYQLVIWPLDTMGPWKFLSLCLLHCLQ